MKTEERIQKQIKQTLNKAKAKAQKKEDRQIKKKVKQVMKQQANQPKPKPTLLEEWDTVIANIAQYGGSPIFSQTKHFLEKTRKAFEKQQRTIAYYKVLDERLQRIKNHYESQGPSNVSGA